MAENVKSTKIINNWLTHDKFPLLFYIETPICYLTENQQQTAIMVYVNLIFVLIPMYSHRYDINHAKFKKPTN